MPGTFQTGVATKPPVPLKFTDDPQYQARGNILRMHDPRAGELAVPNLVPRLTETPGKVNWLGMELGAHNVEIYQGRLGLTRDEMDQLLVGGVI